MPLKIKLLRKTELDFEIFLRGSAPGENVEKNRVLLKSLLDIDPAPSCEYKSEWEIDILNSLNRLRSDLRALKSDIANINLQIFEENFNAISRRFQITIGMPNTLVSLWESVQESWQDYIVRSSQLANSFASASQDIDVSNLDATIMAPSGSMVQNTLTSDPDKNYKLLGDTNNANLATQSAAVIQRPTVQVGEKVVNLSKLPISYDGRGCVFEFLERVSELAASRCIPDDSLWRGIPELLSGDALKFFRQIRDSTSSWSEFSRLLKERFQPDDYTYRLSKQIFMRSQGKSETVSDYFAEMRILFSRLARPMSEEQKLEILLRNVRPVYSNQFGLNELDSVAKLQRFCERLEQNHARSKYFCETPADFLSSAPQKGSSGMCSGPAEIRSPSSGFNRNHNNSRVYAVNSNGIKRSCLRCNTSDHNGFHCPRRNEILCFRCRAPGQKQPTCTNCKAKADSNRSGSDSSYPKN